MEQWLTRTFQLCKKSVVRERGPIKRALEFQLEDVVLEAWNVSDTVPVATSLWAYAWGMAWMLREIELSKVLWEHILECREEDSETLHSKLENGPTRTGSSKNPTVLRAQSVLERMRMVLVAAAFAHQEHQAWTFWRTHVSKSERQLPF